MIRFIQNAIRALILTLFMICGGIFWILYVSQRALEQPEKDDASD